MNNRLSPFTRSVIEISKEILAANNPMTLRQVHYALFSHGLPGYNNDRAAYRSLSRILTNARRLHREWEMRRTEWAPNDDDRAAWELLKKVDAGITLEDVVHSKQLASLGSELYDGFTARTEQLLRDAQVEAERAYEEGRQDRWHQENGDDPDFIEGSGDFCTAERVAFREALGLTAQPPLCGVPSNWIVDELRQGERVNVWENAAGYIETVRASYRRDLWQDQENYCELWGEKATVLGSLRPIAREFGIVLRVCRGFGSAGMEDQVGRLFEGIRKPITVLYVGDHDASGIFIERDMRRRVEIASGMEFTMRRLAVLAGDIEQFKLPPQRVKEKDSRACAFRREFGKNAATVELEALPVAELKRRIVEALGQLIDPESWNRQIQIHEVELASIQNIADALKNLPRVGAA